MRCNGLKSAFNMGMVQLGAHNALLVQNIEDPARVYAHVSMLPREQGLA